MKLIAVQPNLAGRYAPLYDEIAIDAPTDFLFTGARYEQELGLYLLGSRWLDPTLGRFIQADTIIPEASQGVQAWDRYAYVNNSPANYTDPTGHDLEQMIFDRTGKLPQTRLRLLLPKISPRDRSNTGSSIESPFIDPQADAYGSETVDLSIGDPPYQADDPFGEAPPTGHPVDLIIRLINWGIFSWKDYFNAMYLHNLQPNVEISVFYNAYGALNPSHDFGIEVPGMWVVNNSDTNLLLQNASISAASNEKTMKFFGSQNALPGDITSVNINSPNYQTFDLDVMIYLVTTSGTPYIASINMQPFGCR